MILWKYLIQNYSAFLQNHFCLGDARLWRFGKWENICRKWSSPHPTLWEHICTLPSLARLQVCIAQLSMQSGKGRQWCGNSPPPKERELNFDKQPRKPRRYASLKLYPVTLAESMQELFSREPKRMTITLAGTNWRVQTSDIKAVLHSSNVLTNTVKEQILLWIPSNFLCLFKRKDRRQAVFDILGEGRTIFDTTVSVLWTE